MYAQRGKEQIPQFPQLREQPRIRIFVLNFRSSRGNDLEISVRSQMFSVATDFTTQADLQQHTAKPGATWSFFYSWNKPAQVAIKQNIAYTVPMLYMRGEQLACAIL